MSCIAAAVARLRLAGRGAGHDCVERAAAAPNKSPTHRIATNIARGLILAGLRTVLRTQPVFGEKCCGLRACSPCMLHGAFLQEWSRKRFASSVRRIVRQLVLMYAMCK